MAKISTTKTQAQTIFEYLMNRVVTASMLSEATRIPHKNICRYKRDLEKAGNLVEVKKASCEVTRFKAWYITCDKSKFPTSKQLSIF